MYIHQGVVNFHKIRTFQRRVHCKYAVKVNKWQVEKVIVVVILFSVSLEIIIL